MKTDKIVDIISAKSIKRAAVYALLSLLGVFAIVYTFADKLYGETMQYTEKMVGLTTFGGYPKEADLIVLNLVLFGSLIGYVLLCSLHNLLDKRMHPPSGAYGIIAAGYCGVYGQYLLLMLFSLYSFVAVFTGVRLVLNMDAYADRLFTVGLMALLPACMVFAFFDRKNADGALRETMLRATQIVIPVALLGCARFTYVYGSDEVTLFASNKWKWGLVLLVMVLVCLNIYFTLKKKSGSLFISTLVIAMLRVYELPRAIMNIDFFHNGEITVPTQQLVEYGKLPYVDLVPIHGLCDYTYGIISYLLFDGSYLALNPASVVMNLAMAAVFAVTLYAVMEKKEAAVFVSFLFVPFLVTAGMRYTLFFVLFFVLLSDKVRKNPALFVWWYGFLGIVAIAWNPSIGGSAAIAFLPLALVNLVKALPKLRARLFKKEYKEQIPAKLLAMYGALLVMGVAFIPLFLQIVTYLRENTQTTVIANGMGMIHNLSKLSSYFIPGLVNGAGPFWIKTFSCLIAMLCCLVSVSVWKTGEQKKRALATAMVIVLCIFVIASYAFVRYDDGLRTNVLGVFFLLVVGLYYLNHVTQANNQNVALLIGSSLLIGSLVLSKSEVRIMMQTPLAKGQVEQSQSITLGGKQIDDPIVFVEGTRVNMPKLGTGFISGNTLQSLKNIEYVLSGQLAQGEAYLDLSNAVANYVVFNRPSGVKYTSGYNISNERMQDSAIGALSKNPPKLVLLAPYIMFDEATISLRSEKLYRYLLEAGYKPYRYENVIYMAMENTVPGAYEDYEGFAQLMHKENLMFLPGVWGEGGIAETTEVCELAKEGVLVSDTNAEGIRTLAFDAPVDGRKISYIGITIGEDGLGGNQADGKGADKASGVAGPLERVKKVEQQKKGEQMQETDAQTEVSLEDIDHIQIKFTSNLGDAPKEITMIGYLYGNRYVFPVCSSPYFTESTISSIQISAYGADLTNADITLYK